VRKSLKNMNVQLVIPGKEGDATLVSANTVELKKYGYSGGTGNLPSAYLTGLLLGFRAKKNGHAEAILDLGKYHATKGGRVFAALKGAVDSGLEVPMIRRYSRAKKGSLEKALTNTEKQTYQCSLNLRNRRSRANSGE